MPRCSAAVACRCEVRLWGGSADLVQSNPVTFSLRANGCVLRKIECFVFSSGDLKRVGQITDSSFSKTILAKYFAEVKIPNVSLRFLEEFS